MSQLRIMRMPFLFLRKQRFQAKDALVSRAVRPVSKAEQIADEIIHLFETYGAEDNARGAVSQTSHMVQCAMLAMNSMSDLPVIIGALLHDVGHLLKSGQNSEAIGKFGEVNYEAIGAAYLRTKGFSERVCAIVEQQLAAKRYLIATDETYKNRVSHYSLQGGPMSTHEAAAFEKHANFTDIINVCRWDKQAKDPKADLYSIAWFWKLLWDHLYYRIA